METPLTILKAVSDKNRLRIIAALLDGKELCACQITELLQVTGPTVSRHLSQLTRAGLLESRKQGRWIFFFISSVDKDRLFQWIEDRVKDTDQVKADALALQDILSQDPEVICRKQRGEACCPTKPGEKPT